MPTRLQEQLFRAVTQKDLRAMRAAFAAKVDPNFADPATGESPLTQAIRHGNLAMVKILVEEGGADVNFVPPKKGYSPLLLALLVRGLKRTGTYLKSKGAAMTADELTRDQDGLPVWMSREYENGSAGRDDMRDAWRRMIMENERRQTLGQDTDGAGGERPAAPADGDNAPPRFTPDNLPEIFSLRNWVGRPEDMRKLWQEVPKTLHRYFDFEKAYSAVRRATLIHNRRNRPPSP